MVFVRDKSYRVSNHADYTELDFSFNVPAFCDGLSEQWRGNGAKRNDIAEAGPPTGGEA
jgi:hypothetical protein